MRGYQQKEGLDRDTSSTYSRLSLYHGIVGAQRIQMILLRRGFPALPVLVNCCGRALSDRSHRSHPISPHCEHFCDAGWKMVDGTCTKISDPSTVCTDPLERVPRKPASPYDTHRMAVEAWICEALRSTLSCRCRELISTQSASSVVFGLAGLDQPFCEYSIFKGYNLKTGTKATAIDSLDDNLEAVLDIIRSRSGEADKCKWRWHVTCMIA